MTTVHPDATAAPTPSSPDLMAQASRSTTNLAWLNDYLALWQTLRSIAKRLRKMQVEQRSYDMEAHATLYALDEFCDGKIEALQEAYDRFLAQHERIMRRLEDGSNHD